MEKLDKTQQYKENKKTWIENNPLRVWRKARELTQNDVALMIGVGYHMVHSWEAGASIPNDAQMTLIAGAINEKQPELERVWTEWKNEMPVYGT